jgi:hypothetical protein
MHLTDEVTAANLMLAMTERRRESEWARPWATASKTTILVKPAPSNWYA